MATENQLIFMQDAIKLLRGACVAKYPSTFAMGLFAAADEIAKLHAVDAVELPKGKPGDFLEWDNGTGFKQIYCIAAIMICEDCIRYELANFTPVVNHPNIVRIMSREETEKEWKEKCASERIREEPTLTACVADRERKDDG